MAESAIDNTDLATRPLPGQVSQPKIQVKKKGYKGFFTKEAQKQAKERDIYLEKLRKEEEERKAAKKRARNPYSSQAVSQLSSMTQP